MKNYYHILGLNANCTQEDIKKAYRKLSLKFHPDKNDGDDFFSDMFKQINEANETLSNTEKRKIYDEKLAGKDKQTETSYNSSDTKTQNYKSKYQNNEAKAGQEIKLMLEHLQKLKINEKTYKNLLHQAKLIPPPTHFTLTKVLISITIFLIALVIYRSSLFVTSRDTELIGIVSQPTIDDVDNLNQNTTDNNSEPVENYSFENSSEAVEIDDTKENLTFMVIVEKAYFYDEPNPSTIRKGYLVYGEKFTGQKIKNGFLYTIYTNAQGKQSEGWIRILDVSDAPQNDIRKGKNIQDTVSQHIPLNYGNLNTKDTTEENQNTQNHAIIDFDSLSVNKDKKALRKERIERKKVERRNKRKEKDTIKTPRYFSPFHENAP